MKKYVLGIDIGITSVGWGILDAVNGDIVDHGVRLFDESKAEENANRRSFRSSRRVKRRKTHRLERLRSVLLRERLIVEPFIPEGNPYEIRVKGLSQKISKKELASALFHIAKRRGINNVAIVSMNKEEEEELSKTKVVLSQNEKLLQKKEICEVQCEKMRQGRAIRGEENRFLTKYYVREAERLLKNQDISLDVIKEILEIIEGRRAYYDGPGNEKSPTPYGPFVYDENGNPKKNKAGDYMTIPMIEKMRGKCSLFPKELRASQMSYTTCLFNLLNDLNNLEYNGKRISFEQKQVVIKEYIDKKGNITPLQLAKLLGCDIQEINGFRINKKELPLLTECKGWRELRKCLGEKGITYLLDHKGKIDEIIDILTNRKDIKDRKERIQKLFGEEVSEEEVEKIAHLNTIIGYHSLSYKAMQMMMEDLWHSSKNQMQIIQSSGTLKKVSYDNLSISIIPFNDESILSPVAKRAHREALKVVNALRNCYGEMDSIIVEMARDKNSDEQTRRIKKEQRRNEERNERIKEEYGNIRLNEKKFLGLILLEEQEGKCIYTGKPIDRNELLQDEHAFEIDHILPLSLSFDDSMNNKVICLRSANQYKGQKTPLQYFSSGRGELSWKDFRNRVLAMNGISRKKKEYLLFEKDICRQDVQKDFINRNLVDTRYAARSFLNTLQEYFKKNDILTKVHTVRGTATSLFRKKAGIPKDRSQDYSHHAADALIVAGIKKMKLFQHALIAVNFQENEDGGVRYDSKTGEVITSENENKYFDEKFIQFVKSVSDLARNTKYSHKVDRKPNRSIAKQTIYCLQEKEGDMYIIEKYKDIYGLSGEKLATAIRKNDGKGILMKEDDPETYAFLEKIVREYKNEKNPFATFLEKNKEYIRKRSKEGNGPIVKSVRYSVRKTPPYLDISHKYKVSEGKRIVQTSLKPFRIDIYKDTMGKYQFLKVSQHNVRKNGYFWEIDEKWYQEEKNRRNIQNDATFVFSLFRKDVFGYVKEDREQMALFLSVKDARTNIECAYVDRQTPMGKDGKKERFILNINSSVHHMQKYSTDVLGNLYKINGESLSLYWKD